MQRRFLAWITFFGIIAVGLAAVCVTRSVSADTDVAFGTCFSCAGAPR